MDKGYLFVYKENVGLPRLSVASCVSPKEKSIHNEMECNVILQDSKTGTFKPYNVFEHLDFRLSVIIKGVTIRSSLVAVSELIADSLEEPELTLPKEMSKLIELMRIIGSYNGGNTEFAEKFNGFSGESISAKSLKQMMNRWRYQLEKTEFISKAAVATGNALSRSSIFLLPPYRVTKVP